MDAARMVRQYEVPPHFNNHWRVGTWCDEGDPNAQRECEVLDYVVDADGRDLCHVRFFGMPDLFADREGYYSPHELFPLRDAA